VALNPLPLWSKSNGICALAQRPLSFFEGLCVTRRGRFMPPLIEAPDGLSEVETCNTASWVGHYPDPAIIRDGENAVASSGHHSRGVAGRARPAPDLASCVFRDARRDARRVTGPAVRRSRRSLPQRHTVRLPIGFRAAARSAGREFDRAAADAHLIRSGRRASHTGFNPPSGTGRTSGNQAPLRLYRKLLA
jgi:hypothetical protein